MTMIRLHFGFDLCKKLVQISSKSLDIIALEVKIFRIYYSIPITASLDSNTAWKLGWKINSCRTRVEGYRATRGDSLQWE